MSIEAVLVWGGFSVAVLDSTGYGGEINALFDRIVNRTAYYLKNKHSPVSSWMRSFNVWLMVEKRLREHRTGNNPLPRAFAEYPPFKEKIIPFRYLRWRRERGLAFRRVLDRVLLECVLVVFFTLAVSIAGMIWTPLWFALTHLGMPTGEALVHTVVIGGVFSIVFSRPLSKASRWVAEPVIGATFAVTIVVLSVPLAIFRIFPTGYLSVFGLIFAALGAYQYTSA